MFKCEMYTVYYTVHTSDIGFLGILCFESLRQNLGVYFLPMFWENVAAKEKDGCVALSFLLNK